VRAAVAALAAAGALAAPAAAAAPTLRGLHDSRYCEILELKGTPPDAAVTIWNTVGLNACPAAKWHFDAAALAKELGDTAVVLNGPRHWVFDSVTGRVGGTRSFHGLRMRKVGRLPIHSAADLERTPYTDRTVVRHNVWRWRAGRTVYELVAPGGDVYVMQSYAQIVDPGLRLSQLRRLGRRLALPDGWRYRIRTLERPLALGADGTATVIQDELQNTYQLRKAVRRGPRRAHALTLSGSTRTVGASGGPGAVHDRGTVTGTPFGDGTVDLVGTLANGRLTGTFRLTYRKGSVLGTVDAPFTITGGTIDFQGTARLTGGTGAYRGITSGARTLTDPNTLDGQHGSLTVAGRVRY
jgi:hypothetical protein